MTYISLTPFCSLTCGSGLGRWEEDGGKGWGMGGGGMCVCVGGEWYKVSKRAVFFSFHSTGCDSWH